LCPIQGMGVNVIKSLWAVSRKLKQQKATYFEELLIWIAALSYCIDYYGIMPISRDCDITFFDRYFSQIKATIEYKHNLYRPALSMKLRKMISESW